MADKHTAAVAAVMAKNYPQLPDAWATAYTWSRKRIRIDSVDASRRPAARNMEKVRAIAEQRRAGKKMPPVIVVEEGEGRCMVDGYHRWLGCKQAGDKLILAYVGTPIWAELYKPGGDAYEQEKLAKSILTYDELQAIAEQGLPEIVAERKKSQTKTMAELVEERMKMWIERLLSGKYGRAGDVESLPIRKPGDPPIQYVVHVPTEDDVNDKQAAPDHRTPSTSTAPLPVLPNRSTTEPTWLSLHEYATGERILPPDTIIDLLSVPTGDDATENANYEAKKDRTQGGVIAKSLDAPGKPLLEIIDLRRKKAKAALSRRMKGEQARPGKNFPRRSKADKPPSGAKGRPADGKDLSKALSVEIVRL